MSLPFSELVEGFFRESGQQPALVSAQKIHATKNKLISVYSSAAGRNRVDAMGPRAASIEHLETVEKGASPSRLTRQVFCVCVYVCTRAHKQTSNYSQGKPTRRFMLAETPSLTCPIACTCYRKKLEGG